MTSMSDDQQIKDLERRMAVLRGEPPELPPHIKQDMRDFDAAKRKASEKKLTLSLEKKRNIDESLSKISKMVDDTQKAIVKLSQILSDTTQKTEQIKIYHLYLNPRTIQKLISIDRQLNKILQSTNDPLIKKRIQQILRNVNALQTPLTAWKKHMEDTYPELKQMVRAPVVSKQGGRKRKRKTRKGGNQASRCSPDKTTISYDDIQNGKLSVGDKVYVKGIGNIGLWTVTNIVHANAYDPNWGVEITKGREVLFLGSGDLIHEKKRICKSKPIGWRGGRKTKKTKRKSTKRKSTKRKPTKRKTTKRKTIKASK